MANSTRNILVADNDPDTLMAVQFNLKMAGYKVITANNPQQAIRMLEEQIIHLAIIDIRLQNDKEVEYSGLDVAEHVPKHIPCIIYTAYEDTDSIKRALGKVGAKDVLDKKQPGAARVLVETVGKLFASDVKINFELGIGGNVSCDDIANRLEISSHGQSQPATEDVCQILQSLFPISDRILISPMISSNQLPNYRQSGSLVVLVRPHYKAGWGEQRVVKFGEKIEIQKEEHNYDHIKRFLGGTRLAVLDKSAYSRNIGGLIYSLIGMEDWQNISSFSTFYHEKTINRISLSLDRFFYQTFNTIFAEASFQPINITEKYCKALHLTPQKLWTAIKTMHPTDMTKSYLHFNGLNGSFMNPILWVLPGEEFRNFEEVSKVCLCHGDLHSRNILVNSDGDYWLIDFARVEETHAMRDFIELETDIKFNLMQNSDLAELYPFEHALLSPKQFKETVPIMEFSSTKIRKAYKVIAALREVVTKSLSLEGDMREYYEALLLNTLNMLRLRHIKASKKEHALLSASLICQRLDRWPKWNTI